MFRKRTTMMLMAALGAAMSAGGTAAPDPHAGKIKLVHTETKQECVFDDQRAADDFLAAVESPASWAQDVKATPLAIVPLEAETGAGELPTADNPLGLTHEDTGTSAEHPAAPADPAPAPAPAPEAAPAPAAPAPRTRKTAAPKA